MIRESIPEKAYELLARKLKKDKPNVPEEVCRDVAKAKITESIRTIEQAGGRVHWELGTRTKIEEAMSAYQAAIAAEERLREIDHEGLKEIKKRYNVP